MSLEVGSRLAHYDVTALIGEGGMGQVYQATDTKLNRQVALKILPEAFAADPDRLARFQREAHVLASLNHPNIAAIYGLEEADDTRALVLELVEGPTLADRIAQGPIPVDEALPIAKQIAEALEAAHEAGVIHRDLKPANIKVREDGTVKVLDFGLAKALDTTPEGDPSLSPTLTAAATQMGVIMGTAAYMSPEQARGKPVDKRADIWAYGCVLYEMLTRQRAFQGEDVSLTLASVMKSDVNVAPLPSELPPNVRTVLRRCLEKDPKERLRDIGDVRLAMKGAFETTINVPLAEPTAPQSGRWRQALPLALGISAVAGVLTGLAVWSSTRAEPAVPRVERFAIPPPAPETVGVSGTRQDIAISPDGTRVVYTASGGNPFQLYVRSVDALTATPLQGLNTQVFEPFVSPDSAWVGFFDNSDDTLQKVSILGGPPVTICSMGSNILGAHWAEDDTIIFGNTAPSGLWRVSANGGDPEELSTPDAAQTANHVWPHVLPGGRAVLFTITGGVIEQAQIAMLNLETGEQRVLVSGGSAPRYAPTGHIVYGVNGTLRAVGFDLDRLEVTNPNPVPVLDGVVTKLSGAANFDLARDGSLAYVSGAGGGQTPRSLVWVDREGREEALPLPPQAYGVPRLSPDGTRLAVRVADGSQQALWVYDVVTGAGLRLTNQAVAGGPVWTPDGERVVFGWNIGGTFDLHWVPADGSGEIEQLTTSDVLDMTTSVTPDGRAVLFARVDGAQREIWQVPLEGERTPTPVIQGEFAYGNAEVSPNGNWLVYRSDQSGALEIYLQPYPGPGPRVPVSIGGGDMAIWSRDGSEIFYRLGTSVMTVGVSGEGVVGTPTELFDGNHHTEFNGVRQYHVAPDGRFVTLKAGDVTAGQTSSQIVLIQNWFEELKRLVPLN